jgi:hypothetical protein
MIAVPERSILWLRLDCEGSDACRVRSDSGGWLIEGAASSQSGGMIAALSYRVEIDADWTSRSARIAGFSGDHDIQIEIARGNGRWTLNGETVPEVGGLVDIDLGFTPATNFNAIHRLDLDIGASAETTAVWLDTDDWRIKPLVQTYRRIAMNRYAYASPAHGYRAELETDDFGMITHYPELWCAVA